MATGPQGTGIIPPGLFTGVQISDGAMQLERQFIASSAQPVDGNDLMRYVTEIRYLNSGSGVVGDFMSREVSSIHMDDSIFSVIDKFIANSFHIYPVRNDFGQVIGIVKRKHVMDEVNRWKTTTW